MAKELFLCAVLALCIVALQAELKTPRIQVYSRYPPNAGEENTIHCYVDQFYPPNIDITLLRNGEPIENTARSDLSFDTSWAFNVLVYAKIIYNKNDEITCRVKHSSLSQPKIVKWDPAY
uniref:Beta-2-microglobulin n=1 Tax=Salvator merianae TaxID=96440 RepID=A0A8D0B7H7_SALMN